MSRNPLLTLIMRNSHSFLKLMLRYYFYEALPALTLKQNCFLNCLTTLIYEYLLRQRLTELCQENTLVIANILFQQQKRRFYTWTSPHGQSIKIRLIIFFIAEDGEALYSQQNQDWELTGSDHELLIAIFRLKLKKVGKTTRPFRYDLNQIPYDYSWK